MSAVANQEVSKTATPTMDGHDVRSPGSVEVTEAADKLRHLGSNTIPLNTVIIIGDSAVTKTSVLRALSSPQLPEIPSTTPFVVTLCFSPGEETTVSARIYPWPQSTAARAKRLRGFSKQDSSIDGIPKLIKEAERVMELMTPEDCGKDVVRISVRGPTLPLIDLIDVPWTGSATSGLNNPVMFENALASVKESLEDPNSSIVIVADAAKLADDPTVFAELALHDSDRHRTFGLLTGVGKMVEAQRSQLFKVAPEGVKNDLRQQRALRASNSSTTTVSGSSAGQEGSPEGAEATNELITTAGAERIKALLNQLSSKRMKQLSADLPNLTANLMAEQHGSSKKLSQLGTVRNSKEQKLAYLHQVAGDLRVEVSRALDGNYAPGTTTFGIVKKEGTIDCRRLRAIVWALTKDFADTMKKSGHTFEVVDQVVSRTQPPSSTSPTQISREDFIKTIIHDVLKESQGWALQDPFSYLLIGPIFSIQSSRWESIAEHYIANVGATIGQFLEATITDIAGPQFAASLRKSVLNDRLHQKRDLVEAKVHELLAPFKDLRPSTMNATFFEQVERIKAQHASPIGATRNTTLNPNLKFELQLLEITRVYYNVSLNTFVDNIVALAVENCLLRDLDKVFTAQDVQAMNDETLAQLAGETSESRQMRKHEREKLDAIASALKTFKGYKDQIFSPPACLQLPSAGSEKPRGQGSQAQPNNASASAQPKPVTKVKVKLPTVVMPANQAGDHSVAPPSIPSVNQTAFGKTPTNTDAAPFGTSTSLSFGFGAPKPAPSAPFSLFGKNAGTTTSAFANAASASFNLFGKNAGTATPAFGNAAGATPSLFAKPAGAFPAISDTQHPKAFGSAPEKPVFPLDAETAANTAANAGLSKPPKTQSLFDNLPAPPAVSNPGTAAGAQPAFGQVTQNAGANAQGGIGSGNAGGSGQTGDQPAKSSDADYRKLSLSETPTLSLFNPFTIQEGQMTGCFQSIGSDGHLASFSFEEIRLAYYESRPPSKPCNVQ